MYDNERGRFDDGFDFGESMLPDADYLVTCKFRGRVAYCDYMSLHDIAQAIIGLSQELVSGDQIYLRIEKTPTLTQKFNIRELI